jgi:hypothetical protein
MCELRWLKNEDLVETREFSTYGEAQRDLDQLCLFYRKRLGATHAEVWEENTLRYFRGL